MKIKVFGDVLALADLIYHPKSYLEDNQSLRLNTMLFCKTFVNK